MSERLDELIGKLAAAPPDRPLDGLEAVVRRGIRARRSQARAAAALAPVGVGAVSLAMAVGLTVGGATAAEFSLRHASALSATAELAPSTLLEAPK